MVVVTRRASNGGIWIGAAGKVARSRSLLPAQSPSWTETLRLRRYLAPFLAALVLATVPVVAIRQPAYLPSHIAQAVAVIIGFVYFYRFDLWARYPDWVRRSLLIIAFAAPLDNLLAIKAIRKTFMDSHVALEVFRPLVLLLIIAAIGTALARRKVRLPALLNVTAAIAFVSWIISSVASIDPAYALARGFFEIALPLVVVYAYAANASNRDFLKHSLLLFCLGFAVVALSQSASILADNCCSLTAEGFLADKMNPDFMKAAGANGYGNTTNFIALWVLVLPLVAGALYIAKDFDRTKIALLAFLAYAGLLVYSRGGVLTALLGLSAVAVILSFAVRSVRLATPAVIALILAIHFPSGGLNYYRSGISSFANALQQKLVEKQVRPDLSGSDRAKAIRTGLAIARENWITGIGTGIYMRIEPEFTAPHSMLILRFAENGVLGLISILLLFAFAPIQIASKWRHIDPLALSAAISATCFAVYASAFGAAFSDGGLIPWGLGLGLMLSTSPLLEERHHGLR
jgi:hypothetical protein